MFSFFNRNNSQNDPLSESLPSREPQKNYQDPQSYIGEFREISPLGKDGQINALIVAYEEETKLFETREIGTETVAYCYHSSMGSRINEDGSKYYNY